MFSPLNYGGRVAISDFRSRLPISNTECEKDRAAVLLADDSRSDAAIADSFSASFALDGTRENGIMNRFVMT